MSIAVTTGRRREPWRRFAVKAALLLAGLYAGGSYLGDRFSLGIDPQISRCLPEVRVVLIDKHDHTPVRGGMVAVQTKGLAPLFADGTVFVKIVDGLPGDRVQVDEAAVAVNGVRVGEGLDLLSTLDRPVSEFVREIEVPNGHLWLMGRTRDSYDSRYYGTASEEQIVGRAYKLF
ncbi:signal peptidase I [Azospirillum sp. SYSU D00513]|uniref:signal peptidase I n=1 Tax=Azospirillum sp. SYSU D00513 TaxID=2812561 RepID=UPI001A9668ED|nr:signal peptidase I [Azospirillum sp. SYSU D00513]